MADALESVSKHSEIYGMAAERTAVFEYIRLQIYIYYIKSNEI